MSSKPVKILVVDDEVLLYDLIKQSFRKQISFGRYEFLFAPNAAEALLKLKADPDIELVLTDIRMPGMDGLTFIQKILDAGLDVDMLVVSAYGEMDNVRKAMRLGVFDFIPKPIDFKDLDDKITKALSERRAWENEKVLAARKAELEKYKLPDARATEVLRNASRLPFSAKREVVSKLSESLSYNQIEEIVDSLEEKQEELVGDGEPTRVERARGGKKAVYLDDLYKKHPPTTSDGLESSFSPEAMPEEQDNASGRIPDFLIRPGEWVEAKYVAKKLKGGETKTYGPYFVIRGRLPDRKLYTISLNKYVANPEAVYDLKYRSKETDAEEGSDVSSDRVKRFSEVVVPEASPILIQQTGIKADQRQSTDNPTHSTKVLRSDGSNGSRPQKFNSVELFVPGKLPKRVGN